MERQITDDQIKVLSTMFDVSVPLIKTVIEIESTGEGFDAKTGKIKIQFEPHWYKKYCGTWINNGVRPQSEEWEAFRIAYKANPKMAMLSTSWGMGQIMGFNHIQTGYQTVAKMVDEFTISEYYQVRGMLRFIKSSPKMYDALKEQNWREFARRYNGPQYETYRYHVKLEKAFIKHNDKHFA